MSCHANLHEPFKCPSDGIYVRIGNFCHFFEFYSAVSGPAASMLLASMLAVTPANALAVAADPALALPPIPTEFPELGDLSLPKMEKVSGLHLPRTLAATMLII